MTNAYALEGSHVVKVGSYYYIFNSKPSTFVLYCSRSTNLFGPYTTTNLLSNSNGGHQGAIVDMPDGSYYGFAHEDNGAIGRMTYISPVFFTNDWPMWGTPQAPGRAPATALIPIQGVPAYRIPTSDDFSSPTLGLQWQWNHNPDNTRWSLTARPGYLRLHPTAATNFWYARNTLIQKGRGPYSSGEVNFDLSNLQAGDICGLGTLGQTNGNISVTCNSPGNYTLSMNTIVSTDSTKTNLVNATFATASYTNAILYLRLTMDYIHNIGICSYSPDGINWTGLGNRFSLAYNYLTGTFQGEQYAIFCYNANPGTGYVDVDWFRFEPPAFIANVAPDPDSSMTISFENSPNSTNIVQASPDLNAWRNIFTNVANSNGTWQVTDPNAGLAPVQFYRSYTH